MSTTPAPRWGVFATAPGAIDPQCFGVYPTEEAARAALGGHRAEHRDKKKWTWWIAPAEPVPTADRPRRA